jgi:pimeloyl-ACP methyl ester carboxylesterase
MRKFMFGLMLLAVPAQADTVSFMPYAGHRLAIHESSGARAAILLIHGNSSSASSFSKFLDGPLCQKFHCVAPDLPGCGKSDNFPAYSTALLREAVVQVAGRYRADQGIIVGWSLGGNLALQAAGELPQAKGFFLFGTTPLTTSLGRAARLPSPFLTPAESYAGAAVNYGFVGNLPALAIEAYVQAFFAPGHTAPASFIADGLRADPKTRDAVGAVIAGQDRTFADELVILHGLRRPTALFLADHDAFVRPAYLAAIAPSVANLWGGQVWPIFASGHAAQWEQPESLSAAITAFALEAISDQNAAYPAAAK